MGAVPGVMLTGVCKAFGGNAALVDLTARVRPGCITGLVGPDGAGKTTLVRLVAGLLTPSAGHITVDGLDPVRDAGSVRAILGYMPQRFGLYEDLTVMENLRLHAELQGLDSGEQPVVFERLFMFTGLAAFQARRAGRLSGGMKQKLGLACALLRRPRLLVLDEPSVGVDPLSRRELWRMVRELCAEDTCIIWSTAYLDEAERCDEVLLLNGGRLLFQGRPGELTARLHGRTYLIPCVAGERRRLLARVTCEPWVRDGVIQGRNVRLVCVEGALESPDTALGLPQTARAVPVAARFEDAFVDILGGLPAGRSALAGMGVQGGAPEAAMVDAEALTKRFGDFTAADNITFRVPAGHIFGLLGPNGAGKSTTFKMMCGLLRATSGRARIAGVDLLDAPEAARGRLGYMAQKFSLYGDLSVLQNLAFFAGIYGLAGARRRDAIDRMVSLFHLAPFARASAGELPLGFKQRLALACAVMHNPPVLFLDEPTSGVDPITRREFWRHIGALVENGVSVVVTTHFMDEAEYCDEIGLIYRGRMIARGAPDDLKERIRSADLPDPTLEDAFIGLIRRHDAGDAA